MISFAGLNAVQSKESAQCDHRDASEGLFLVAFNSFFQGIRISKLLSTTIGSMEAFSNTTMHYSLVQLCLVSK